jgi:hypothetical protein
MGALSPFKKYSISLNLPLLKPSPFLFLPIFDVLFQVNSDIKYKKSLV